MMRSTDTNPIITESYLREALADLNSEGVTAAFGMFFLHDLNLDAGPEESVLPEIQNDSELDLSVSAPRPKIRKFVYMPRGLEDCNMDDYPLGRNPTWSAVKRCLRNRPQILLREWLPVKGLHNLTQIGSIFVTFTSQFWTKVHPGRLKGDRPGKPKENEFSIDTAMKRWTMEHIRDNVPDASFEPCNSGFPNSRPGKMDPPFYDRRRLYFPLPSFEHNPKSEWLSFLKPGGYLHQFHQLINTIEECEEDNQSTLGVIDEDLKNIFDHLQCLPFSQQSTKSSKGLLWSQSKDKIRFMVNPKYLKVDGISHSSDNQRGYNPLTISKREFEKKIGLSVPPTRKRREGRTSTRTLGRRKPPARQVPNKASEDQEKTDSENVVLGSSTDGSWSRSRGSDTSDEGDCSSDLDNGSQKKAIIPGRRKLPARSAKIRVLQKRQMKKRSGKRNESGSSKENESGGQQNDSRDSDGSHEEDDSRISGQQKVSATEKLVSTRLLALRVLPARRAKTSAQQKPMVSLDSTTTNIADVLLSFQACCHTQN
jgi:hypothetical protein